MERNFRVTFQLLDGDLKTGGPSVSEPVLDILWPSPMMLVDFQPFPASSIFFAASAIITLERCIKNHLHVFTSFNLVSKRLKI